MVTHWSILTNDTEIKEDVALSFGYSLASRITHSKIQELLSVSHQSMIILNIYFNKLEDHMVFIIILLLYALISWHVSVKIEAL